MKVTGSPRLLEVENIQNDFRPAIHQNDVSTHGHTLAIRRRRGQLTFQVDRDRGHVGFQRHWKCGANH